MAGEKTRFTSDRRVPSKSSWVDGGDWDVGVGENVEVVDGELVGRAPIQHSELPDSGVSRYRFEQDWTGAWNDNDATNNGADFVTTAHEGEHSASFNGSEYVNHGVGYPSDETFTLCSWVYPEQSSLDSQKLAANLKGDGQPAIKSGSNALEIQYHDSSSGWVTPGVSVSTVGWYFVAGVWEFEKGRATAYVYSVNEHLGTDSAAFNGLSNNKNAEGDFGTSYKRSLNWIGNLDDPRIYHKPLTSTEVENLWSTGSI